MKCVTTEAGSIHIAEEGAPGGAALLFINSLGADFRIWSEVVARLPASVRAIRYDKRGHGLSDCPPRGSWGMGDHVADAAAVLEALGAGEALVVGLSIGGQIAQGLAAERPDLVRALALCGTGAKIGAPGMWDERIRAVEAQGIEPLADATMERWFTRRYRKEQAGELRLWRNMLTRTSLDGYLGSGAAIRDTDLYDSTARLRLPAIALCGDEDGSTPPDLVRETAALIPGSEFHMVRGAGHLLCIEQPEQVADLLTAFMRRIGHV